MTAELSQLSENKRYCRFKKLACHATNIFRSSFIFSFSDMYTCLLLFLSPKDIKGSIGKSLYKLNKYRNDLHLTM